MNWSSGMRLAGAMSVFTLSASAAAGLSGTSFDVEISHTGAFGFTESATMTYGGPSVIISDPNAPVLSMAFTAPAPGGASTDQSLLVDFTNFQYVDFSFESGSLTISGLDEDADPASLQLQNGDGTAIGSASSTGDTITLSWDVNDVLAAGGPDQITVGWNSLAPAAPLLQERAGDPLHGLTPAELDRFNEGLIDYTRQFTIAEGLGPVFNRESCGSCHNNPIGGPGSQTVTRFGLLDKGGFTPLDTLGGSLLQAQSISVECNEVIPAEANITSLRVTPGALGYGLIEAIPDADILALESAGPGVSGRAHIVEAFEDPGVPRVGRFGWKAQVATLLTFSADAAQNEIGFSNRFLPFDNDPNGVNDPPLIDCDDVEDPEDGPDGNGRHFIDRVTDFQRFLAAPPQTPKSGMAGEVIFTNIGCAQCHTPEFTTSSDAGLEESIRGKTIRPYSDFLLHDMGTNADFIGQGDASEQELRTPPLWGLRFRDPVWHDGRIGGGLFSDRMALVILEHGGFGSEGADSVTAWNALSEPDKALLVRFLDSLGRIEFDMDGDDDVDHDDVLLVLACREVAVDPDHDCAYADLNQDGAVDENDLPGLLIAFEGTLEDCDNSGTPDIADIFLGKADDLNNNGIPDSCESCQGDLDESGGVDVNDLLQLFGVWGPCPGCPEDLDGSGAADLADMLMLFSLWGDC